jgi:hypothetical protein
MTPDRKIREVEKPFSGCRVYFSNSISLLANQEAGLGSDVIQYMVENGAEVLDRHVGGKDEAERIAIFKEEFGFNYNDKDNPKAAVEQKDIELVDRATHVIAFVDGPSHGVGNEIQRAIDRYEFKGDDVRILCLVSKENAKKLSWMISGKDDPKYPMFHLRTYWGVEDAKAQIFGFLMMG